MAYSRVMMQFKQLPIGSIKTVLDFAVLFNKFSLLVCFPVIENCHFFSTEKLVKC